MLPIIIKEGYLSFSDYCMEWGILGLGLMVLHLRIAGPVVPKLHASGCLSLSFNLNNHHLSLGFRV